MLRDQREQDMPWAVPRATLIARAVQQKGINAVVTPRRTLTGKREVYAVLAPSVGTDDTLSEVLPCAMMGEVLV